VHLNVNKKVSHLALKLQFITLKMLHRESQWKMLIFFVTVPYSVLIIWTLKEDLICSSKCRDIGISYCRILLHDTQTQLKYESQNRYF